MPVVVELVAHLQSDGFKFGRNVRLFGTQHLLAQTLGLCGALNALGLSYDRMALTGKAYSTHRESVGHLRALGVRTPIARSYPLASSQAEEQVRDLASAAAEVRGTLAGEVSPLLLVIDDGGHALTHARSWFPAPCRIVGVEQTASGFRQPGIAAVDFPTVDVAASAVKRHCEPAIVIDAVLQRTGSLIDMWQGGPVGVVGLGYIGMALCRRLAAAGVPLLVFDERADSFGTFTAVERTGSAFELIDRCGLILGCTGSDITRGFETDARERGLSSRSRTLISLSSGDSEFFTLRSMLLGAHADSTYAEGDIPDIAGSFASSPFVIRRNGFPINFDNSAESAPLEQIQGTIAALLAALCQAWSMADQPHQARRTMLDPPFQQWLFERWDAHLAASEGRGSRLSRALIERLSEPRSDPQSTQHCSSFGSWTKA